ncbi:MAG: hypothetical protein BRC58_05405 [Cyanobacteria bacterium QS_8_64_29]|nr:MAG: hypothetical protein BRC58_05405 [Cyanobacteria bacterium QS_8_64_29]
MKQQFPTRLQLGFPGGGCLLTLLLGAWVLGSLGLGWVVNALLIAIVASVALPALAWTGFRLWLRWKVVADRCPICGYEFAGFNNTQCRCPSCGETLQVQNRAFERITPQGTVDVEAVDVSARQADE